MPGIDKSRKITLGRLVIALARPCLVVTDWLLATGAGVTLIETVAALLTAAGQLGPRSEPAWPGRKRQKAPLTQTAALEGPIAVRQLARCLRHSVSGRETCLIRAPLSWAGDLWDGN